MTPLIEVFFDDREVVDFKVRTSHLNTQSYGRILATIAIQLADIYRSEGGHDRDEALRQIVGAFNLEVAKPTQQAHLRQMQ